MNANDSQGGTGKNSKNITSMTHEQAKQAILEMVDRGEKYREISQVEFMVDGRKKRFGISQISGFVNERNEPPKQDEGDLAAAVFELFEDGKGPVDAVIELHVAADKAEELYKRWVAMKEVDLSQKSTPRRLKEIEDRLDYPIQEIVEQIREAYNEDELESAPDFNDIWALLAKAKDLTSMPITNLGGATCKKCGSKGLNALQYQCTKCGEESWWGKWPKEH